MIYFSSIQVNNYFFVLLRFFYFCPCLYFSLFIFISPVMISSFRLFDCVLKIFNIRNVSYFFYFCVLCYHCFSYFPLTYSDSKRILFYLSGFCVKDNPNESMDLELLLPNDEIFRVRALSIKKFHEDYKKISPKGLIFAFCDFISIFIFIFIFISSQFFWVFFITIF